MLGSGPGRRCCSVAAFITCTVQTLLSNCHRCLQGQEPQNIDKEFLRLWFRANCDPYNDPVGGGSTMPHSRVQVV